MVITKETIIADVLNLDEGTAAFFAQLGLYCIGCPSAGRETISEACRIHKKDSAELVNKINEYLVKKMK